MLILQIFLLLPDKIQQLLEQRSENAANYSGIFYQKSSISQVPYTPPDFVHWNVMLSSGYYDAVRADMHDYLLRQKRIRSCKPENAQSLFTGFFFRSSIRF